jgi:hypothetical protein
MVDVEAVELAIGGEIDTRLALNVEHDPGRVEPCLLAGKGRQPGGDGI